MAARIREHDWASTPLKPIETWPERLRLMVEQMLSTPLVSALVCGPDHILIYNDAASRLYGDKHPAALGCPLPQTFPEGWATVAPLYAKAFAGETVQVVGQPLDTRGEGDPDADVFDAVLTPVLDDAGRVASVHMTGFEVGDRVRTEAALRESEERFRTLVMAASYALYSMSPDWTEMRYLNGRGFLADTLVPNRAWLDAYVIPEDQPAVLAAVQQAIRTRNVFKLEHRVRRADGSLGWTLSSAAPLLNADGEIVEWFGAVSDVTDRRVAEERLRQSEETLRLITDNMPAQIGFYDRELRYAYVNAEYGRFFGVSHEALIGRKLSEWLRPDAYARIEPYLHAALRGERVFFEDCEPDKHGPGLHGWTEETYIPRQAADGSVDGFYAFVFDVTERKTAEAALRESEERLRQFGEASSDVLWVRDAKTLNWEYLSPAFESIYGLSREAALAREGLSTWADLIVQEDLDHAVASIGRVAAGETVRFEYRVRRPDGEIRWLRDTDFPIRGPDGTVCRIGGVGQDATELKLVEAALRDEEARQRALVEGIPQLVWRSADGGMWTWCGPQWRAYTGQSEDESRDWGWAEALHPDDRETAREAWRIARQNRALRMTCRIRNAETGDYHWFQVRGAPIRQDGRMTEWIGSCTDIDEQMRAREMLMRAGEELERRVEERTAELMAAEATLRQAQKMEAVGQLTSGIAHDFNNMLQGISNNLELIRRRAEQGRLADATRHVENARDTVQRAAALTHRLLAFSRQQTLAPVAVNLDELVVGMTEMIRRTVGPSIQVEVRLADGTWPVRCDPSQLENALLNLCVNARDAMPDGGWLTILTNEVQLSANDLASESDAAAGPYGSISVTDTGVGMTADVLARVFEPFFTTKPLGQGTGLGLSQVYGFVSQSGGLVRIESTPQQGTTVRLFLPRHDTTNEARASDAATAVVLLVEDEANLRAMAAEWLRDAGLRVIEAADGAAAMRLLHGGSRVDVLVTDVGLPGGMNGRQVAEAARSERPDLPVLFITGYAGNALRTALPRGMAVMDKPFALDDLVTRIRTMLAAADG